MKKAHVLASGALVGDREFAIVDSQGKFVHGKRTDAVHHLRSSFDLENRTVSLQQPGQSKIATFSLEGDRTPLEHWLTNYFRFPVQVIQNTNQGFPDDTASPGPTLISIETLKEVTTWFPGIPLENLRQRLRTNLEIDGVEAFWEERLYSESSQCVPFQIGQTQFLGINPCQRCIVPSRDPQTGHPFPNFQRIFVTKRQQTLPAWAEASRFNHFYRLAINTRRSDSDGQKILHIGDQVDWGNSN